MPFFKRRVPETIEAVPFKGFPIKGGCIEFRDETFYMYNLFYGSWVEVKIGDFIRIDNPNNHYPIDKETFQRTYDIVEGGDA